MNKDAVIIFEKKLNEVFLELMDEITTNRKIVLKESIVLFNQSFQTLNTSRFLLSKSNYVDALVLMRSGLEYLFNAVTILDDKDFFEDYKTIMSEDKNKNKLKKYSCKKIINKFIEILNKKILCSGNEAEEVKKEIEDLYSMLSKFAHGYINVCAVSAIDDKYTKKFLSLSYVLGYYSIDMIIIRILDYYNNTEKRKDLSPLLEEAYFSIFNDIVKMTSSGKIDLDKCVPFMYSDVNEEFYAIQKEYGESLLKDIEQYKKELNS